MVLVNNEYNVVDYFTIRLIDLLMNMRIYLIRKIIKHTVQKNIAVNIPDCLFNEINDFIVV